MRSVRAKKLKKTLLVTFGFLFLCSSIIFMIYKRKGFTLAFPSLDEISYLSLNIKNDSAHTNVLIELQNKNPYKLNIDTFSCEVLFNDTSIAQETIPLYIRQVPGARDTVNIPFHISGKKIMKLIKNLEGADSTFVQARGYVAYQTFFGKTKLKFDKRTRIEVPIPPKIRLVHMKREKFDLKNKILRTNALFEITNPGKKIDLQLSEITYELYVKNNLHSKGKLSKNVTVKPRSNVLVNIPMIIEVYHPLKTALLIRTDRDRLPYTLHITFFAIENISKKTYSAPVDLHLEGYMELEK